MRNILLKVILITLVTTKIATYSYAGVDKVDIYCGKVLLQSWPEAGRTITVEVDSNFPPDTITFYATSVIGGVKQLVLKIKDISGATLEQIVPRVQHEDSTKAAFMYVLNKNNLVKITSKKFRVILENPQANIPEIHSVALFFLNEK